MHVCVSMYFLCICVRTAYASRCVCVLRYAGIYLAVVQDQDTVTVQDGVDAVGDGEHGAVLEGLPDGVLNKTVRL